MVDETRLAVLEERVKWHIELMNERRSYDSEARRKVEDSLRDYKEGANEWRDTVKDLIGNLRESRSMGTGKDSAVEQMRVMSRWIIGLVVTVVIAIGAMMFRQ